MPNGGAPVRTVSAIQARCEAMAVVHCGPSPNRGELDWGQLIGGVDTRPCGLAAVARNQSGCGCYLPLAVRTGGPPVAAVMARPPWLQRPLVQVEAPAGPGPLLGPLATHASRRSGPESRPGHRRAARSLPGFAAGASSIVRQLESPLAATVRRSRRGPPDDRLWPIPQAVCACPATPLGHGEFRPPSGKQRLPGCECAAGYRPASVCSGRRPEPFEVPPAARSLATTKSPLGHIPQSEQTPDLEAVPEGRTGI